MITLVDISAAVSRVLSRYDVREAYLFGSFAVASKRQIAILICVLSAVKQ